MQRTPLKEIDPNQGRGDELSPYCRGIIQGLQAGGHEYHQISDTLEIPQSTVQYTLKKNPLRQQRKSFLTTAGLLSYLAEISNQFYMQFKSIHSYLTKISAPKLE
jgi:hypothetical protein